MGKVVWLAAHRSGRRPIAGKEALELLVRRHRKPGPVLDPPEESSVIEYPAPERREGHALPLAKIARLLEKLVAERSVRLNVHDIVYSGLFHHNASGNSHLTMEKSWAQTTRMLTTAFLARVDVHLARLGKSHRWLAIKAGLSPGYFADLRRGKTRAPNSETVRKIAAVLGVDSTDLDSGPEGTDEQELLHGFRELSGRDREIVMRLMDNMRQGKEDKAANE